MPTPDISKLKATLQTSGLSQKNQSLYQVIWGLIEFCQAGFQSQAAQISSGGSSVSNVANQSFVTVNNDIAQLPNSRRIIAGTGITLDISVAGEITINGAEASVDHVVLSDGVPSGPTPVDDGAGNFIYIPYAP